MLMIQSLMALQLSVTRASMQEDLNLISLWVRERKLEFNIKKSMLMHFGGKNISWEHNMIGGDGSRQLIDSLAEGRDLGTIVDEDLKTSMLKQQLPKHPRTLALSNIQYIADHPKL